MNLWVTSYRIILQLLLLVCVGHNNLSKTDLVSISLHSPNMTTSNSLQVYKYLSRVGPQLYELFWREEKNLKSLWVIIINWRWGKMWERQGTWVTWDDGSYCTANSPHTNMNWCHINVWMWRAKIIKKKVSCHGGPRLGANS